ncbi:hypothetical protein MMC07_003670 [Pseudocyphellaria aurata]|nr:hypothetical protein [Pseudocyphellaria aurata]
MSASVAEPVENIEKPIAQVNISENPKKIEKTEDLAAQVEEFNLTSDWSARYEPPFSPDLNSVLVEQEPRVCPTVAGGGFHYRNTLFNASALSLVVCCGMHGVFTAEDTADVLSHQPHDPPFKRILTADDVKGVLRGIVLENSNAYQVLKILNRMSTLVRGILAPMVAANCVRMRPFFQTHDHETRPSWHPRTLGPIPERISLYLSHKCENPSESTNRVEFERSTRLFYDPTEYPSPRGGGLRRLLLPTLLTPKN